MITVFNYLKHQSAAAVRSITLNIHPHIIPRNCYKSQNQVGDDQLIAEDDEEWIKSQSVGKMKNEARLCKNICQKNKIIACTPYVNLM